jgi:2-amino-4-hydroxy-6-hydroxymethyldihydropteridine diphosphokinase
MEGLHHASLECFSLERCLLKRFPETGTHLMTQALIAFGANLGDAHASLKEAAARIAAHEEVEVVAVASPLVTAAVSGEEATSDAAGNGAAPDYLNSVIRVETSLAAEVLFQFTRTIENDMGRQRRQRWGPRTIDLDIVLFGGQIIDTPQLQVPHRRMSFRKFVIKPAAEIAGQWIEPISGVSLAVLADRLRCAPKRILWIAGDDGAAEVTVQSLGLSGWEFKFANDLEGGQAAFEDFRLMAFSNVEARLEDAARRFAGPWLDLTGLSLGECQREIRAALQAMA